MRDIKFKAFSDGVMYEYAMPTLDGGKVNVSHNENGSWNKYVNIEDCELMQYTGLKDRKGKEIYEGDIVSGGSRVMIVKFEQQACQFWLKWKDNEGINRYEPLTATFGDDKGYMCNHGICVIGNIYENPELLK